MDENPEGIEEADEVVETPEPSQAPDALDWQATARAMMDLWRERLAEQPAAAREWFTRWLPMLAASQRLAVALGRLLGHLRRELTESAEGTAFPPEMIDDIGAEFQQLIEAFPDASRWLFGPEHVDALATRLMEHPTSRETARRLAGLVANAADRMAGRWIESLFFDTNVERPSSTELLEFMRRAEAIVQQALDRWFWPYYDTGEGKR